MGVTISFRPFSAGRRLRHSFTDGYNRQPLLNFCLSTGALFAPIHRFRCFILGSVITLRDWTLPPLLGGGRHFPIPHIGVAIVLRSVTIGVIRGCLVLPSTDSAWDVAGPRPPVSFNVISPCVPAGGRPSGNVVYVNALVAPSIFRRNISPRLRWCMLKWELIAALEFRTLIRPFLQEPPPIGQRIICGMEGE